MLRTQGLNFVYPLGEQLTFPDLNCKDGEHCLILGQSGSGKTTLLHLIAGLRTAQSGSVVLNDTNISELSAGQLDRFRGRNIGIVFQQSHFVRSLTLEENLVLAQRLARVPVNYGRIASILAQLNLEHKLRAKPEALSIGEQQRAAIARAILNQPTLILADEPTSALDDANTEQVIQLLQEQAASVNASLLIVTHDNRLKTRFEQQIQL
ncbi:MAG TPA: ABC transporter ATP-binding protein [Haliscomenobacter sp.]|uniref:ABC transporter ATP-binding protein n=1 Tax=Haliscomenobacter sp. TaxID=2717303 RepID=UPI002CF5A3C9|nr:ABC transporter ATP-binding protein [Haliscomenobacter sp.]HOY16085.1 ABC transporter ATP-binding protein [Haliscomenobacter sp.]HPH20810.1 ABC transporter ATP-binding protein [Haliscomenobacter sp.]